MKIEAFATVEPTDESFFRSVVMFGRNVASYKFALAKTLVELAREGRDLVPLTDLAAPFAAHICQHLNNAPKQATSRSSSFLNSCRQYNDGAITNDQLAAVTVSLGFQNVIDAFHRVGTNDIPVRFFLDQRGTAVPSIAITDRMRELAASVGPLALEETEARWRLVETAWELGTSTAIIGFDTKTQTLVAPVRRRTITSARSALNAYQRGRCFYCYRTIETARHAADLADVDHVFPHVLERRQLLTNLDGVWNLVLACQTCNRGHRGKFDATPATKYVERLQTRNEYLILSHNPLRETLILQTGPTSTARHAFLQQSLDIARIYQSVQWSTEPEGPMTF